uniref:Uncharacterized protein n=1 Tax=Fagus sylvatica TaxID=28930 RepID=A0A2N9HFZ9_FAGSY
MLGASSNNHLSSSSRNVVVPAPNEPGRKIEMYSLLLHHRYASNSKWVYSHVEGAIGLIVRTEKMGNGLDKLIKHHSLH